MSEHSSKPSTIDTHYIPWATPDDRPHMASCGRFIWNTEHSDTPTCGICQEAVKRDADDEVMFFKDLGYVELRPGVMIPGPDHKKGGL